MIEETTKEALLRLDFSPERAAELSKGDISTKTIINNSQIINGKHIFIYNHIVIDGRTNTVYSEIEGARKYYFGGDNLKFPSKAPSLFNEYYNLKLELYIKESEALNLPQSVLTKEFYNDELIRIQYEIEATKDKFKVFSKDPAFTKQKQRYLNWLNDNDPTKAKSKAFNFLDFIQNVKNKETFANDLKDTFDTETSTSFAIIVNLLEIEGVFKFSEFAPFYREIKRYFNREIGNQNTINDALSRLRGGTTTRERAFNNINDKVNVLIDKHKI